MTSGTDPRIAHLTELFSELPGLGPRSASRLVADLLTAHKDIALALAQSLEDTVSRVGRCRSCNPFRMPGVILSSWGASIP